ncbi:hypothetical protein GA0115243_1062172 [Streptomyces sp. ScaeMP-e83]|nr:hypothetical protein GA0115243_1062172 [Streptomyces sp. ScaeMP-e83]
MGALRLLRLLVWLIRVAGCLAAGCGGEAETVVTVLTRDPLLTLVWVSACGCCHVSSSDCRSPIPVGPRHRTLWRGGEKRTVCLLVKKTSLKFGAEIRGQNTARAVDQKCHFVPDQTDIGIRVGQNGE